MKKKQQHVWNKQYDNNVLVGTSRQGPALTDAPQIHTHHNVSRTARLTENHLQLLSLPKTTRRL